MGEQNDGISNQPGERAFWDSYPRKSNRARNFSALKAVRQYLDGCKGDVESLIREHAPAFDTALSVACGDCTSESMLKSRYGIKDIFAFDISYKTLAEVNRSQRGHLQLFVADANRLGLGESRFDIVFCTNAAHHIENLEGFFADVNRALKPGGILVINDYIGPNRLQHDELALTLCNRILNALPDHLKVFLNGTPKIAHKVDMATISENEAIRSEDIERILKSNFDVIYEQHFNKILMILLNGIAHNFDETNGEHKCILDMILLVEELLDSHPEIPYTHMFALARKRDSLSGTHR